ncbi:MAG: fused MFS/spermidine synthase [Bacteroidales bacterium]|nr:fused MFS/spermidine synthase [Bacteroidales bacterium]
MRGFLLEITVFFCGAVVMAFEIMGSRMLGPYVGTSLFVWSSIIGVILASLSLGYFLGGRLADRLPRFDILAMIIFIAGVLMAITTVLRKGLMDWMTGKALSVEWIAVWSSLLLFFLPGMLLGMVSPFAARLRLRDPERSGSTVGTLYALSTAGSILGTFAAGFLLIPHFSISVILYIISVILIVVSTTVFLVYRNAQIITHP